MTGQTIIMNPTRPENVKRREFILESLRTSGLEWCEEIEENRIVISYHGESKHHTRTTPPRRKLPLPPPVTLDKCLRSRFNCDPDEIEYWDEMIRLAAERESVPVDRIRIRTKWETEQWAEAWAVLASDHLAVNRADGYWTITHRGTGLAAGTASTLRDAVRIARAVATWPEWAMLRGKDDITPEFRRKANEAFKAVAA
jgi:hypothetical protein